MNSKEKLPVSVFILTFAIICLSSMMSLKESSSKALSSRGAESAKELSNVLFHAIKLNNFQQLLYFIPGEGEVAELEFKSDEKTKLFFESLEPEDIKANILSGFEKITREGIEKNINWADAQLVDYETRVCNLNIDGCTVTYTIEDQNANRIVVTYDAIKVNKRWFLFQNLNLGPVQDEVSKN